MGGLVTADSDSAAVHLLRTQHRNYLRDLGRGQGAERGNARDKASSDNEILAVYFVSEKCPAAAPS